MIKSRMKDTLLGSTGRGPMAALVPSVARVAFSKAAPGVSQLIEAWAGIVGPALADATMPRRLSQATLTINCSGPMAMELQHASAELISRINRYFGIKRSDVCGLFKTLPRGRRLAWLRVPTLWRWRLLPEPSPICPKVH